HGRRNPRDASPLFHAPQRVLRGGAKPFGSNQSEDAGMCVEHIVSHCDWSDPRDFPKGANALARCPCPWEFVTPHTSRGTGRLPGTRATPSRRPQDHEPPARKASDVAAPPEPPGGV